MDAQIHMINFFRDTCMILLDRYEEARPFLIKGCCQLCLVGGDLGSQAMAISANACSDGKRQDAVTIILEVLSPLMEIVESLAVQLQFNLMTALTRLPHIPQFSACLQPFIHNIVADIIRDPWSTAYIGLLKTACLDEDNLIDLLQYRLPEKVIPQLRTYELGNGSLFANSKHVDRICQVLDIVGLTIRGIPPPLLSQFIGDTIIPNLKELIGEREGTSRLNNAQASICSTLIRLCNDAIVSSQGALEELCFGYHLFDLLLVPVKEAAADPLVLAASLSCLVAIMENPKTGETFVAAFTEDVNVAILMAYLKPERMEKLADMHRDRALTLVSSIANFIAHLLTLVPKQPRVRQLVDIMYEKGLLIMIIDCMAHSTVDSKVRAALVRALVRFPLEKIDAGAINIMLELLVPSSLLEFEPDVFEYIIDALKHKLEFYSMEPILERTCWLLIETLKNPDTHRYQAVHLKCACLLQKASLTQTGRLLLRDESKSLSLRKALKYEEEFCAYDHADIRVELACVGGDVDFLNACMFDTFRLKSENKQIFRVCRALNLAISDVYNGYSESEVCTIEDICALEVEDFCDEPLKPVVVTGDYSDVEHHDLSESDQGGITTGSENSGTLGAVPPDVQLEKVAQTTLEMHRDKQQQIYISMEMPKRILSYLSPAFSLSFTERYLQERRRNQHSEYWAGILKGRKLDCERLNVSQKFDWKLDCSDIFAGDSLSEGTQLGEAITSPIDKPTRHLVSYVIGNKLGANQVNPNTDDPFYWVLPRQLLHKVWINESKKVLNPCFVVSSYLRTLYALMATGVSNVVRDAIKAYFRDADFVRNLIKLSACSSFLDANITAKLLRTSVRALTIDTSVQAESMDVIVVYDILARFTSGVCGPLMDVVTSVSFDWVEAGMEHIQLVLLRVFQLFAMFARQLPWVKFSNVLEIQQYFVETCVVRCLPDQVLSLVLRILFQIVALETSSSVGTYVSHLYQSKFLEPIRDTCTDIAVAASCAARNTHYQQVINAISEQRHSNSLLLRPSFVSDLLRRIQLADIGKQFQEHVSEKRLERVLLMDDIWLAKKRGTVQNALLALTSRYIYILKAEHHGGFKIKAKFRNNAAMWEVENGLLHAVFTRDAVHPGTKLTTSSWALFTLRHTPAQEFRRFVTEGNKRMLETLVTKHLSESVTYLGVCQHDDMLCVTALTNNKMSIFALKPNIMAEYIRNASPECHGPDEDGTRLSALSEAQVSRPHEPELDRPVSLKSLSQMADTIETATVEYSDACSVPDTGDQAQLELLRQCFCYSITKVAYGSDLGVAISFQSDDEDMVWEMQFVSDSRREAFKKALARSIGHLEWFRHWERI
ncbi:leucine rich repeat-containing, putative [Babesia ovis]|uniref:Leucine rich repeat-containing, putative n=1 Tax=Babesia ovis TaxID=5869 RepID=A0A9W5WVY2_BABOV|nr:leucine rich repeat-containing, putative [Babesia ovis]